MGDNFNKSFKPLTNENDNFTIEFHSFPCSYSKIIAVKRVIVFVVRTARNDS